MNQSQTECAGAAPTISLLSLSPTGSYIPPWAPLRVPSPSSSSHMVVYVLLSAFFIHSLDSSAISLLPVPSPPQHGAELQPRLAAEEDLAALPCLTWL